MMTAVFETLRFRVHILGKTAWVESKESEGSENWVFRAQFATPVTPDLLTDIGPANILTAAVQDFEGTRQGDKSLRAALTGFHEPRKPQIHPTRLAKPLPVSRKRNGGQFWMRQPLRPPLLSKLT